MVSNGNAWPRNKAELNIVYLSTLSGGVDTAVRGLGSALAKSGHRVSVFYVHQSSEHLPSIAIDGCNIYHGVLGNWHYYLHRLSLRRALFTRLVRGLEYAGAVSQVVRMIAKKERIDVIELPEIFMLSRPLARTAYIIRLHSSAWTWRRMCSEDSPWTDEAEAKMEGLALKRARAISSPSGAVAEYIRWACDLGARPIEIIPYPIDTQQFVPSTSRSDPPLVLFVGRVEKRKGADVLIRAMSDVWAKHPDCKLVMVGRRSADLNELLMQVDGRVRLLGSLPRSELVQFYQRAAIFVAPSSWDNSPNTIYEAMSSGTPVIATRVGGIPELVDDGITGVLVPPRDQNALAEAITALLSEPERRERMGRFAREKAVARYTISRIMAHTLAFYERSLADV